MSTESDADGPVACPTCGRGFLQVAAARCHHTKVHEVSLADVDRADGEVFVDPFVGSGTTCLVADRLGRRSIGYEASANYNQIACDRIANRQRNLAEFCDDSRERSLDGGRAD